MNRLMPEDLLQLFFVAARRQLIVEASQSPRRSLMFAIASGVSSVSGAVPPAFDNEAEALWPR